jgi:CheY-like chemotaxis protein
MAELRVLVVDDCQDAADTLEILLGLWGYETRVAYDGPTALEALVSFRADVVLLDISMAGMDGYEVARRIRRLPGALAATVLIAVTGWSQEKDFRTGEVAGFDYFFVKPLPPEHLQSLLSSLEEQRSTPPDRQTVRQEWRIYHGSA